jgi:Arc/MetJ-type ribon-helix-helix transcriptional regulator
MPQVQLRLPEETLKQIDAWVAEGKFKSRSDAIRTIISLYEERRKTANSPKCWLDVARKQKSIMKY